MLGLTCMFVDQDSARSIMSGDGIAVMYLGKIVEIGPAQEVFHHPVHPYTRALIDAVPIADPKKREQKPLLNGEIGSSTNPPSGLPLPSEMSVCDGKLQTGSAGTLQCFPRQQSSCGVPICNCAAGWRRTRIRCEDAAGCRRAEMEIKVTWENI